MQNGLSLFAFMFMGVGFALIMGRYLVEGTMKMGNMERATASGVLALLIVTINYLAFRAVRRRFGEERIASISIWCLEISAAILFLSGLVKTVMR